MVRGWRWLTTRQPASPQQISSRASIEKQSPSKSGSTLTESQNLLEDSTQGWASSIKPPDQKIGSPLSKNLCRRERVKSPVQKLSYDLVASPSKAARSSVSASGQKLPKSDDSAQKSDESATVEQEFTSIRASLQMQAPESVLRTSLNSHHGADSDNAQSIYHLNTEENLNQALELDRPEQEAVLYEYSHETQLSETFDTGFQESGLPHPRADSSSNEGSKHVQQNHASKLLTQDWFIKASRSASLSAKEESSDDTLVSVENRESGSVLDQLNVQENSQQIFPVPPLNLNQSKISTTAESEILMEVMRWLKENETDNSLWSTRSGSSESEVRQIHGSEQIRRSHSTMSSRRESQATSQEEDVFYDALESFEENGNQYDYEKLAALKTAIQSAMWRLRNPSAIG